MNKKEFNKINKQNRDSSHLEKLLKDLSRDDIEFGKMMKDDAKISESEIIIDEAETEQALRDVNSKLGFGKENHVHDLQNRKIPGFAFLAAAVLLIAFAAGWILFPRTTTVPYGQTASLNLPDGSRVELNSGTRLSYNLLFGTINRDVNLNGEAYFTVETAGQPFMVKANGTVTEVTGTEFNVRSWDRDPGSLTTVTVTEGEVLFYPESDFDDRKTLSSGFSSYWSANDEEPSEPDSVNINRVLAWKNDNLSFVNQPLQVIFAELERKFDTDIEIENDDIRRETLTTFYTRPQKVEMLLNDITTVKGLQYRETSSGYYVFKKR